MECERASQAGADLAGVAESKAAPPSVRQAGAGMIESSSYVPGCDKLTTCLTLYFAFIFVEAMGAKAK